MARSGPWIQRSVPGVVEAVHPQSAMSRASRSSMEPPGLDAGRCQRVEGLCGRVELEDQLWIHALTGVQLPRSHGTKNG